MPSAVVAVTAAAGKTGQAVARELLAKGLRVRALVRQRDARSEALARLGAEVVVAERHPPATLVAGFLAPLALTLHVLALRAIAARLGAPIVPKGLPA